MKTLNHFGLFVGLIAMTSCLQDKVIEVNNGPEIGFRSSFQTKGLETRYSSLEAFYVTALEEDGTAYFSAVPFLEIGDAYNSSPSYYWPGDGRALDFYAWYPAASVFGGEVTVTGSEKKITGFTPAEDITSQVDFVSAILENQTQENLTQNGRLDIQFEHNLSSILLYAKSSSDTYKYTVAGYRISQVKSTGNFNLVEKTWEIPENATKVIYEQKFTDTPVMLDTYDKLILGPELSDRKQNTHYNRAYLLPQQLTAWDPTADPTNEQNGAYLSVYIQINTTDGVRIFPGTGEYGWVAVPIGTKWERGYTYNYYLDFTNGAGYLDPEEGEPGSVLGEPVKVNMSMSEFGDPDDESLLNQNMLGKWVATKLVETNKSYSYAWNAEEQKYEYTKQEPDVTVEEYTDVDDINAQIDGFQDVTVFSGTQLKTIKTIDGQPTEVPSDYIITTMGDYEVILLEVYKSDDGVSYDVVTRLLTVNPAVDGQNGYGHLQTYDENTTSDGLVTSSFTQDIYYTIHPLN